MGGYDLLADTRGRGGDPNTEYAISAPGASTHAYWVYAAGVLCGKTNSRPSRWQTLRHFPLRSLARVRMDRAHTQGATWGNDGPDTGMMVGLRPRH